MSSKRTLIFPQTLCPLVFPVSVKGISIYSTTQTKNLEGTLEFHLPLKVHSNYQQILTFLSLKDTADLTQVHPSSDVRAALQLVSVFPPLLCYTSRMASVWSAIVPCTLWVPTGETEWPYTHAGFMGVWPVPSCSEGRMVGLVLCCLRLGSLGNFLIRACAFPFCTRHHEGGRCLSIQH